MWSDAALSTSSLTAAEFDANLEELRAYMAQLIEEHRRSPAATTCMTSLIDARDVNDRLSELELVDLCVGILVAGHETTATQIPNFVLALLDHPASSPAARGARADQGLRRGADAVRTARRGASSPVTPPRTSRSAARWYGPGARPGGRRSRQPGRAALRRTGQLDIARGGHTSTWVRPRRHHCLGAPLARLELQEALGALIGRFPTCGWPGTWCGRARCWFGGRGSCRWGGEPMTWKAEIDRSSAWLTRVQTRDELFVERRYGGNCRFVCRFPFRHRKWCRCCSWRSLGREFPRWHSIRVYQQRFQRKPRLGVRFPRRPRLTPDVGIGEPSWALAVRATPGLNTIAVTNSNNRLTILHPPRCPGRVRAPLGGSQVPATRHRSRMSHATWFGPGLTGQNRVLACHSPVQWSCEIWTKRGGFEDW